MEYVITLVLIYTGVSDVLIVVIHENQPSIVLT